MMVVIQTPQHYFLVVHTEVYGCELRGGGLCVEELSIFTVSIAPQYKIDCLRAMDG